MQQHTNGKTERRQRIREAAELSAKRYKKSITPDLSIDNPYIKAYNGGELNIFDASDGYARILLIAERINDEEAHLHAIKWNCDPIVATNLILDGIPSFRREELNTLNTLRQVIENSRTKEDIIPDDYVIDSEVVSVEEDTNATDGS